MNTGVVRFTSDGPVTYKESIKASFVCPGCGFRKSERKGFLARKNIRDCPALYCMECIKDMDLIMEPEEKDRKQ